MRQPVVTRIEVYYAIEKAFASAPLEREDLISAAREHGGRPELLETLAQLPERRRFARLRDLWEHFPDMPTGS
jgi:hypothetical protein